MTPFGLLALGPTWAVTLAVGFVAARLARRTGPGLLLLCLLQGAWVTGLLLLDSGRVAWAERLLPSGMLLAGAFVQSASDVAGRTPRWAIRTAWAGSLAVSLTGLLAPRLLYGEGARGAGPLFLPLALASVAGTLAVKWHLLSLVRAASEPRERLRRSLLFVGNVTGAVGGGGAITLHILGLGPVGVAAPFLVVSVVCASLSMVWTEVGRTRALFVQGLALAVVTAAGSSVALLAFTWVLPSLVPGGEPIGWWGLLVAFLVVLPLDPLRHSLVDRFAGSVFARPLSVRELAAEAESAQVRAEHAEALAQVGLVAGGVAHEVRNPLGVILAEAKLLERTGADPESVATIRAQVARAGRFVDELLHYAKPRPPEPADFDAAAAIREGAGLAAKTIDGSDGRLALDVPDSCTLHADRAALVEVVRNLVSNALIATAGAGAAVRVAVHDVDGRLRVTVEDDGPGVPAALQPRLFEPFATGRGRDDAHPGTGLGLALCARHVRAHGGTIRHERPATGGARFVVDWPKTLTRGE